ncbi:YdeI/OmpD-associated family protein [bacterium]|nr:YdeI/OmpD-associated family protein [bacterium]
MNEEAKVLEFSNRSEFRNWLTRNHHQKNGIWIAFQKGGKGFTAHCALEEAICFGWIDGLLKNVNEKSYKKYFSRRRDKNNWSEKNKKIYEKMLNIGLMTEAGTDVYKPKKTKTRLDSDLIEKKEILRIALREEHDVLQLYNEKSSSRQKQLACFYCEAKTEETRNKRKAKIIEALRTDYKGMLY